MVIDGEGEMVGRESIGLQQHVVVQRLIAKWPRAHHQVVKVRRPLEGDGRADDEALAARGAPVGLLAGDRAAAAIVSFGLAAGALLGAHLLQPLRCTEAAIRGTLLEEHVRRPRVNVFALRLDHRWLVPAHAEPAQTLYD